MEEISNLRTQNAQLQAANTQLQAENAGLQAANTQLQAENAQSQTTNTQLHEEKTQLQAEERKKKEMLERLYASITNREAAEENYRRDLTAIQTAIQTGFKIVEEEIGSPAHDAELQEPRIESNNN